MASDPTYNELKQKIQQLEKEAEKHHQVEEALRESEEKFKTIFENASEEIVYLDNKGIIIDINDKVEDIFGYKRKEVIGKNFIDLGIISNEDASKGIKLINAVAKGAQTEMIELQAFKKDGSIAIIEVNSRLIEKNGEIKGVVNIIRDITARKQAEEALRESEKKYYDIFNNVSDYLYFHNMEGIFIETNELFNQAFGPPNGKLSVKDIIVKGYRNEFSAYINQIKTYKRSEGLMKVTTKNGKNRILEYRNSLVDGKDGPVGVRGSARDITERRKAEQVLKESEHRLKELVDKQTYEIRVTQKISIEALARLAEYNDTDTGKHLVRIQKYVRALTEHLKDHSKYSEYLIPKTDYLEEIELASLLHDIGKVAIPTEILTKPGKLTKEEFEIIKNHTTVAGEMLEQANLSYLDHFSKDSYLALARDIAYYHHEKWNGKGYPCALKTDAIPLSARITAVADVYDALTTKRAYKVAWSHEDAVAEIKKGSGEHFDPHIVESFMALADGFREISEKFKDPEPKT